MDGDKKDKTGLIELSLFKLFLLYIAGLAVICTTTAVFFSGNTLAGILVTVIAWTISFITLIVICRHKP